MPPEPGKPSRKLPERGDALKIDLSFEEAVRAALETTPEAQKPPPKKLRPKPKTG